MKISHVQSLLSSSLSATCITVPENTPLFRNAVSVMDMARAYESDGATFFTTGDLVNALACCWYGFGWLHFGISYGILDSSGTRSCPFSGTVESVPPHLEAHLAEKTGRYARLLNIARSSVVCAPDPSTASHDFASRVLYIADVYARQGDLRIRSGSPENALTCFSYGHGWLDAGVKTGLFRIIAERDLFTV
jgi:hypothetical protein